MNGRGGLQCQKEGARNCVEKRREWGTSGGGNEIKAETCGKLREKGKQRTKGKSIKGQDNRRRAQRRREKGGHEKRPQAGGRGRPARGRPQGFRLTEGEARLPGMIKALQSRRHSGPGIQEPWGLSIRQR